MIRQTKRTQAILRMLRLTEPAGVTTYTLAFLTDAPAPSVRRLLCSLIAQGAPIVRSGAYWVYNTSVAQATADAGVPA